MKKKRVKMLKKAMEEECAKRGVIYSKRHLRMAKRHYQEDISLQKSILKNVNK